MDYKTTLNLPRTDFPMKANLKDLEPRVIEKWRREKIHDRLQEQTAGRRTYILHDGPPYANGHIHIGHALNKILKDIIVKFKTMEGFRSPYVPGWDCHGLPIEHQVLKSLGPKKEGMSQIEIRRLCREYAEKFIDVQREEFKRLGVFGDWDHPYLTMDFSYEAAIVRELGKFVAAGGVYKGKKPVYWCGFDETALAEAEVEYADHESPSVYVRFELPDAGKAIPALNGKAAAIAIWTTTPWTLVANLAVALHPEFDYVAVETGGSALILAEGLLKQSMEKFGFREYRVLDKFKGRKLEGLKARHPFITPERESLVILGDHVTLEAGTGAVHTAPGHGQEDYEAGLKYGLEVYAPVDSKGRFTKEADGFAGQQVFKANKGVIELLRSKGALLAEEKISHSYPHCWRCKNPVIFRATEQWFISMKTNELLKKTVENIHKVSWVPSWGKDRILGMMENRPDWCISRQRAWGVPIVAFTCKQCGELLSDHGVVDHVAGIVAREGADAWFVRLPAELLPPGAQCKKCGGGNLEKEMDILDVWFDSGVSHAAVLRQRKELSWPADLYLEGSDQHRGWFQSSLLTSVATTGRAPYNSVLTHGFTVDGSGKKMSKSAGNVVAPQEVIDRYGAEVLRLWVSAADYRDDIRISQEILTHLAEAYRRIRNTSRYLLGNLADFDPGTDRVSDKELLEIDRWALHRLQRLSQRVRKGYDDFEFHIVFHSIHNFCAVDMSAFYLDILKDRLYTAKPKSVERRSGQTAMYEVLSAMVRLMAPVLSFTADEVWGFINDRAKPESVFLAPFPQTEERYIDEGLEERWDRIIAVRGETAKVLEALRRDKKIGHSLDAGVTLYADPGLREFLSGYRKDLAFIFIVSSVEIAPESAAPEGAYASDAVKGLRIAAGPAKGAKCGRCWMYSETVGKVPDHPAICERCAGNL
ncbi:MAG TPA: isoleucine--tRNA ligase [Nitrospirota bacterium]|nr:isoleucine--tRNA ligase [Nitrospirota bacterium]